MGASLTIEMFGPMRVQVDERPLPPLRSRKALWLLALLTLRNGREVPREWVASTLWPDSQLSVAFNNLRPVIFELRKALGDQSFRLRSPDRVTVLLDLEGASVDLVEFDRAMQNGDHARAARLYRGPLLEGCPEEWAPQERNVREQELCQALQALGNAAYEACDYAQAVERYGRLIVIDPWRDAPRRALMKALAKSGDVNAALQTYRDFAQALRQEGGLSPDEKTTALYQKIRALAQQGARSPRPEEPERPHSEIVGYLPHALTALVGREDERIEVSAKLRRHRLVTLLGLGGMGKTRLATAVAKEMVGEYRDGAWFVSLEALSDPRLVAGHVMAVLGVAPRDGHSNLATLTDAIRSKKLLLVLDNCEHIVAPVVELCAHLLRECGALSLLATSREALNIMGERVWLVPSLATPELAHLPQSAATLLRVLNGYDSVQLFVERAQAANPSFEMDGQNAAEVAAICARLEGVPLSIELAAARMRTMTIHQISERLGDHLRLLSGGNRGESNRHKAVRATLDWSFGLLDDSERTLFQRLAVFVGGWTLEAAEMVCDAGGDDVTELHRALVDKSMIQFDEKQGRFRFLETVRQYAEERLIQSKERGAVRKRQQDWLVTFTESAEPCLRGPDQQRWLDRIEAELPNLRQAIEDASDPEFALRTLAALSRYWRFRGLLNEGACLYRQALEKAPQTKTVWRAKALEGAGSVVFEQGHFVKARDLFRDALEIRDAQNDPLNRRFALAGLSLSGIQMRNFEEAIGYLDECVPLVRASNEPGFLANLLSNRSLILLAKSEMEAAKRGFLEAVEIQREIKDDIGLATSCGYMADVEMWMGNTKAALAFLEEGEDLCRRIRYTDGLGWILGTLGRLLTQNGEPLRGREIHEEALRVVRDVGDHPGLATRLYDLGLDALELNDENEACRLLEKSLALYRRLGDPYEIGTALTALAPALHRQGEWIRAEATLTEALQIHWEIGNRKGIAEALTKYGWLMVSIGNERRAACLLASATALRKLISTPLPANEVEQNRRSIDAAEEALGAEDFAALWERGSQMSCREAVAYAREHDAVGSGARVQAAPARNCVAT